MEGGEGADGIGMVFQMNDVNSDGRLMGFG